MESLTKLGDTVSTLAAKVDDKAKTAGNVLNTNNNS